MGPAALEVAAEDRRDGAAARGRRGRARDRRSCSSAEYRDGAGRARAVSRTGDAAARGGRIGGDRSRGPPSAVIDFTLTDENRLVQQTPRERSPRPRSCPHIREWDERGEVHREVFAKMAEQGFLGAPIPERVRRRRDGLHQLRAAVRGARAGRHRVPGRPERPRRAQLPDAPPVGDRGAAAALARAPGEGREAGDVRADRARRRHGRREPRDDRPARRRLVRRSTARRSGSASPTSPTTSSSSPRSTGEASTRASPRSCSSAGCPA